MEQLNSFGMEAKAFRGFGGCSFWPFRSRLQSLVVRADYSDVRRVLRETCPSLPGVYGMVNDECRLVYVGVSLALRKRLVTYFQSGETLRKERRIAAHARRLVWEVVGHELAAQLRELELIRRHQPRFNVRGRRQGRPLGHIYISDEIAPRLRIARRVPKAVCHSWGPLAIGWRIREAVEIVNRMFKLCDCSTTISMRFADQSSLFSLEHRAECLRGEIGTCLAPCAGQCTRRQYFSQLRAARAFLDGGDAAPLALLEKQLADAAEQQQYERAARLRDSLELVTNLCDRLTMLREPPLPAQFVYSVRLRHRMVWYLIADDRVIDATSAPTDARTSRRAVRRLQRAFHAPRIQPTDSDRLSGQILAAWFRTHPAERRNIITPEDAYADCRISRI